MLYRNARVVNHDVERHLEVEAEPAAGPAMAKIIVRADSLALICAP